MQRNVKTTVLSLFFSFCPQDTPLSRSQICVRVWLRETNFMVTFRQGTGHNLRVIAACHACRCDRPSQHPGCLQSCGYTERSSTLEGGVVASLGEYWLLYSLHFPQTNHILLVHVKQNGDIPSTKQVCVMPIHTVLISDNGKHCKWHHPLSLSRTTVTAHCIRSWTKWLDSL